MLSNNYSHKLYVSTRSVYPISLKFLSKWWQIQLKDRFLFGRSDSAWVTGSFFLGQHEIFISMSSLQFRNLQCFCSMVNFSHDKIGFLSTIKKKMGSLYFAFSLTQKACCDLWISHLCLFSNFYAHKLSKSGCLVIRTQLYRN